ncbi:MAG: sugar transferase [Chitinophagaceae bacterium]|nr:sugar transferase [Chitinophagaceae bacterium]
MYRLFFKRFLDVVLATIIFIIALPVFFIVAVLLYFSNRGKAFFFQKRPGKNEKIFQVIKFKTMNDRKDAQGQLLPDGERITALGRFVRNASLDEIPQLINVIKGDMSIVGPRPLLVSYLPLYNSEQKKRHHVRPGITGWAQVNGRNSISWEKKFELDVWYVEHYSLSVDIRILYLTILKVLKREGIDAESNVPMRPFTGSLNDTKSL